MRKSSLLLLLGGFLLSLGNVLAVEGVDPDDDDSQYAYAANLGWINAEPSGNGGPGLEISGSDVLGWLWSANTGWISLNCQNTASCGDVGYGVSHDGSGNLSGYGWSPNIGWVSFSCTNTGSCGNVDFTVNVDPGSGELTGYAYAANAGWISLSCTNTASCGDVDYGVKYTTEPPPELLFEDSYEAL